MSYALVAVLAAATLLIGLGIGFWIGRSGRAAERAKLSDVETELGTYREQVTEHFAKTAHHFENIGQQYRELYAHMAAGSEALCVTGDTRPCLPFSATAGSNAPQETPDDAPEPPSSAIEDEGGAQPEPTQPPADYVVAGDETDQDAAVEDPSPDTITGAENEDHVAEPVRQERTEDAAPPADTKDQGEPEHTLH